MQLDGPDLEELLVRARDEYGEDVRIVKADKVRSGGFGGFFTREHYELSIELGETVTETLDERPISLLDLADAISDREISDRDMHARQPQDSGPRPFTPGFGPAISTEGESFASILAGLAETVADKPVAQTAVAKPVQPSPSTSASEVVIATRPRFAEPDKPPRVETRPARRSRTTQPQAVSLRDLRDLGMPRTLLPTSADGDLLGALVGALKALPAAPELPKAPGNIVAVVGEGDSAWDSAVELARSIGVDERALVYLTAGSAPAKVAPARRVTELEQLGTRIDRWRKRSTPTIAVVDAPMSLKAASWNRQALNALDAEAVWLVVPATRKTDDVAGWASRLGHMDGLVITDIDASSDPASVLQLGVPVAWLDGRPATPGAWAGLLVDRLVGAR